MSRRSNKSKKREESLLKFFRMVLIVLLLCGVVLGVAALFLLPGEESSKNSSSGQRLESLEHFGVDLRVPRELQRIHSNFKNSPVKIQHNAYRMQGRVPAEEGPAWFDVELAAIERSIELIGEICGESDECYQALKQGTLEIVPFKRRVVLVSESGKETVVAGYWEAEQKKLYLDRRSLLWKSFFTVPTFYHEAIHGLDPTLNPEQYRELGYFPAGVNARAEIKALTAERDVLLGLQRKIEKMNLPSKFKQWLLGNWPNIIANNQNRTRIYRAQLRGR